MYLKITLYEICHELHVRTIINNGAVRVAKWSPTHAAVCRWQAHGSLVDACIVDVVNGNVVQSGLR